MSDLVSRLPIEGAGDVFALRQSGRVAAAVVGCDEAAQVRFATALSELGREAFMFGRGASATFFLDPDRSLRAEIDRFPSAAPTGLTGLDAARRLIDDVTVRSGESGLMVVALTIRPRARASGAGATAATLRAEIERSAAPRPLDELRLENRDLVAALSESKAQQEQLARLNDELEETNRGVLAMYAQLADELEETNRGVVALYAELDDKTMRLNDASEAKSRFLASVSHELRSPVNSILGLARLLMEPDGDTLSAEQHKQLGLVRSAGTELLDLVNQLLDLAKAESGRLDPAASAVDLAAVFSELRGALRPLLRPGVELSVDVPNLPPLETDRTLLVHVLRNLLTNAVKFTPAGSVRLSARSRSSHEIEISVADTGIGIAAEDQAKVFEEFYQVRGPLQSEYKGTGLGLPYARRVTQTLGGELTLESEPGRGCTFTVVLPRQWQTLLRSDVKPGRQPGREISIGIVLIVDDDVGFRTALRGMLQNVAGRVLEAQGGREGLAAMRSAAPDLAFIDLWMPDMDGAAVLAEMNSDSRLRSIPAVLVTSAQLTTNLRASLGSAAAVLSKTNLSREDVLRVVGTALDAMTAAR